MTICPNIWTVHNNSNTNIKQKEAKCWSWLNSTNCQFLCSSAFCLSKWCCRSYLSKMADAVTHLLLRSHQMKILSSLLRLIPTRRQQMKQTSHQSIRSSLRHSMQEKCKCERSVSVERSLSEWKNLIIPRFTLLSWLKRSPTYIRT